MCTRAQNTPALQAKVSSSSSVQHFVWNNIKIGILVLAKLKILMLKTVSDYDDLGEADTDEVEVKWIFDDEEHELNHELSFNSDDLHKDYHITSNTTKFQ